MYSTAIFCDPQINNGKPVFAGTRVSVEFLFDHLRIGSSINEFLQEYPSVTRDQVMEVIRTQTTEMTGLNFATQLVNRAKSAT